MCTHMVFLGSNRRNRSTAVFIIKPVTRQASRSVSPCVGEPLCERGADEVASMAAEARWLWSLVLVLPLLHSGIDAAHECHDLDTNEDVLLRADVRFEEPAPGCAGRRNSRHGRADAGSGRKMGAVCMFSGAGGDSAVFFCTSTARH